MWHLCFHCTAVNENPQGIEEIEEWNEYDELHEALGVDTAFTAYPPKPTSLFEPAPSKTPPPLADALPGGFSFGQSAAPAFGSLGAAASKGKENTPVASAEQNLAIRQMGAEAAKIAASKKPQPVKISMTNPLLTEKTNAKSPADAMSPKSTPLPKSPDTASNEKSEGGTEKTELPDVLSPRSIPLPETPGVAAPMLQQQKPVHAPPSMHDDAENPALSAGPIKTTQVKKESSEEEEGSDEEESSEESSTATPAEKTQDQDPKDASKAGVSVREGEQEDPDSKKKTEAPAKIEEKEKEVESKTASAKDGPAAPQAKQSSSEETSEEGEEEESEEEEKQAESKKVGEQKPQAEEAKDASKAGESILD